MTRKNFIIVVIRSLMLGLLALLSAFLIFRDRTGQEDCSLGFLCDNCRKVENCKIPEAVEFKKQKA